MHGRVHEAEGGVGRDGEAGLRGVRRAHDGLVVAVADEAEGALDSERRLDDRRVPAQGLEVGEDLLGDARVVRRDDLAPVLPVDLIAIVPGGIMARGDHDAGHGAQLAHAKRHERRVRGRLIPPHLEALRDEGRRRELRERLRVVPRVAPDDDAALGSVLDRLQQVRGEPLGRLDHGQGVHAREAGLHGPAQARGAEGDAWAEAAGELGGIASDEEVIDFVGGRLVPVEAEPFLC